MAESFARRMMAQRLMTDARATPFSDSAGFGGRSTPDSLIRAIPDPVDASLANEAADLGRVAYGGAAMGSLFLPGAGVTDVFGYAPDPFKQGEFLPSFGENVTQGKYLDAGLQTLGVAGDVLQAGGAIVPPLAALGTALKTPRAARVASRIKVTKTADVSDTFGEGAKSVTYTDPDSGGFIEVVQRKDGPTSVLALEVPEQFRGSGIGQELQAAAMADNPMLQGQVSSKAAAVGAYRLGRRPVGKPNATLEEVFSIIDDQSSVLMKRPDPNQAAGAAMDAAQARYFETGQFEPPTAENPVSVVLPTETEPGIIAFHGSGADFDEFRLEMIGTGEGAQAYGYGLYFTDSEDIAKFYRNTVSTGTAKIPYGGAEDAAQAVPDNVPFVDVDGYRSYSMEDAEQVLESVLTKQYEGDPPEQSIVDFNLEILKKSGVLNAEMPDGTKASLLMNQAGDQFTLTPVKERTGKIYKVALSPKPDELLDHDAPFSQQSKDVQEKLIKAGYELDPRTSGSGNMIVESIMSSIAKARLAGRDESLKNINARLGELAKEMDKYSSGYRNFNDPRGQVLADEYDALLVERENLPTMTMSEARKLASQELAKAGIPGIKYRAAGSRGAATADEAAERNYVIFDDKAVKILEKYGIAGPVLVTGAVVGASKAGNDNENGGSILPDAGVL